MLVHGYLIPQTVVVVPLLVLAVSLVASWMLCSFGQGGRDCSGGINRVFDNKLDNMTTYGRQKSP